MKVLSRYGISGRRLGELVGMPQPSIWRITRQERVMASTAAKILAVKPDVGLAADNAVVDSTGSGRRVQALQVLGWRAVDIAEKCGVRRETIVDVYAQRFVTAELARKIAAVFDELQATPGPSEIVRRRSLGKGWVPPMAWSDETIDDPAAVPDVGVSYDWRTEFLLAWEDARNLGLSERVTAERLGLTVEAMRKRLQAYVA
jgi:plasmid maintenance system antidote protein VapI